MSLTVHTKYSAEIDDLIDKNSSFGFLKYKSIPQKDTNRWYMTNDKWNFDEEEVYISQVMFIGKTGYGKSTTLNKIVGKDVFESSDVEVCTKDLYSAVYRIKGNEFFSLNDLPGIGESNYADNHYYDWYRDMLERSKCVVYVLRADQRDFAVDQILFKEMFKTYEQRKKVIFALNYADKIEPINRKTSLSEQQIKNLDRKVRDVANIFNVPYDEVIYYSAIDRININLLVNKICEKLKIDL